MTQAPVTGPAFVTGGAKRIGAAICRVLARAGHPIVIHYNASRAEAESLAAEIRGTGGKADIVGGDLAALDELPGLMARASKPFGVPALLVNNASVFPRGGLETLNPRDFSEALAVNLQAPVLLAQHFSRALPETQRGAIINLVDQRVLRPSPVDFGYTLSKAALFHATKTLAQALAPHIRVNAVAPGPTLPNIADGQAGFRHEAEGTLLGKASDPMAVAEAVLYLARAETVTGQMIAVDSGQHLGWITPDTEAFRSLTGQ